MPWTLVKRVRLLGKGHHSVVCLGLLTLQDQRRVPVAYKLLNSLNIRPPNSVMAEAVVIHLLQDVQGVPRLYGVTDSPPQAVVMTFCPGEQLEAFHTPRTARTFLTALQRACRILLSMHAIGVSHGDVHPRNILVQAAGDTEQVAVHLVDFGESQIFNDEREKRLDALNLLNLARSYVAQINKHLYPDLHRRRHRLLQHHDNSLDLSTVSELLCSILHGYAHPYQHAHTLPCTTCSASQGWRAS